MYNNLVTLKNRVVEGWSGIDVMLKKRNDLVPKLVEVVKGYTIHERTTLDSVTQARIQSVNAKTVGEQSTAEENLNQAMTGLYVVAEQYPDLKANTNYLNLQEEISAVEGDLEKSRRYYNGTVRNNNIAVESFPGNLVATIFQFKKAEFFKLDHENEREVPNVK
ncbi:MAG: LemA family protein [Bacteroidetes bacterium]|nr:LemA family protein [Bacteroidota bacterium]MBS1633394.1 LemA family protein [Bacteroidota bacterium]